MAEGENAIARVPSAAATTTMAELAALLRGLRRREARRRCGSELTYREIALRTGWSHGIVGEYLGGRILPPADRFDVLIRLLGATVAEQGPLATARDRVAEYRRPVTTDLPARHRPVPRQLPPGVAGFVGRAPELAILDELAQDDPSRRTAAVAVVAGTAGVGKTSLAIHWAHSAATHFPDGQLYANLRGFDPGGVGADPAGVVRGFLDALGVARDQVPGPFDAQVALYRSMLAGRRVLVLLDNARDAEQVLPLLPGAAGCLALVTSRRPLGSVVTAAGAELIPLGLLPWEDARRMVTVRLGAARVAAEPDELDQIIGRCARLPLALAVLAFRAALRPRTPLRVLVDQLRRSHDRLDAFADEDPALDVRSVLSWSYDALSEPARRLFRQLGIHPGPDISAAAVISLAGTGGALADRALAELVRAGLVMEHESGRFTFHDLLRAYAAELAAEELDAHRQETLERLVGHYLHSARAADELTSPERERLVPVPPPRGVHVESFAGDAEAHGWWSAERQVLLRVFEVAADAGLHQAAWQLGWFCCGFLHRRGHWREQHAMLGTALSAALAVSDRCAEARIHNSLGQCSVHLGRYAEAEEHFRSTLAIHTERDDLAGQAHAELGLSWLGEWRRQPDEALAHGLRALELYEASGDRAGYARALNVVGWRSAALGRFDETLVLCGRAVPLLRELGQRHSLAATWHSLGYAHHHRGEYDRALECYGAALDLTAGTGDRHDEATIFSDLGDTRLALGEAAAARTAWEAAVKALDELGHRDVDAVRAKLRALDEAG